MNGTAKAFKLPGLKYQFFIFWAILCLIIIGYTDLCLPALLGQSDYLMTFHTAGYIAAHGLWDSLYPAAGALNFAGAAFDRQAHALLPQMPKWSVAEYMYMPVSAYIFAPLSQLAPNLSLICWQLVSIGALYLGNFFILQNKNRAILASCAAFAFVPLVFTLWIGQVGLVFALLPLAAGFHLLTKKQYFLAGLVFALLTLKPQMLIPAFFMIVFELGRKHFAPLAGLITGGMIIAQLNYAVAGAALCQSWINCLAISDRIYSDPSQGVAVHLATSLPRAILLSQPLTSHHQVKPLLYGVALLLLLVGLGAVLRLAQSRIVYQDQLKLAFVLGCLALPIVVPHLFLYDLGALVPAAIMIFFEGANTETAGENDGGTAATLPLFKRFQLILKVLWITVTCYCLALVINQNLAPPLLLVAIMLGCYLSAAIIALRSK